jgi:MFS family permease
VFLSVFQLLPTAPFHILDLGGSTFASGLFLGFLTFASAWSAPITGAIADRIGRRRTLLVASGVICLCSVAYALLTDYRVMLALVVVHGIFWSGLLSASAAYLTNMVPVRRRAEGIAYWGLSSVAAVAVAPPLAFWIFQRGWVWICVSCGALNVLMGIIAWTLQDPPAAPRLVDATPRLLEWRVLVLAVSLSLYSYGYGAITTFSAVYADAIGITPKSLYLTTLAIVILLTRPLSGTAADRIGYRRVFLPSLVLIAAGLGLLAARGTLASFVGSAVVFGVGFGTAYPVFVAYVMRDIDERRRGAAFGAILAAFDTGIGTGSTLTGWLIQRFGFPAAFGTAAALAAISLPYFLLVDRRLR